MTDKSEAIKYLQIRFPLSYAGSEYCLNVLPENSSLDHNGNDKLQINNYPNEFCQADIANISNLSISDGQSNSNTTPSLSSVQRETKSRTNAVQEVNNSFQPPNAHYPSTSNIYPNLQVYQNQYYQTQYQPMPNATGNPKVFTGVSNILQHQYPKRRISHRKTYRQRHSGKRKQNDSEYYSDNPSDYESDHNLMKMRSGLYHDRDYYDKDRDYYYYKTKDGCRYKHYKY